LQLRKIVDDVTRECIKDSAGGALCGASYQSRAISSQRVVRYLNELIAEHGKSGMIVSDNPVLSDVDRPTQNVFVRRINGRMREELLNETLFMSLNHARVVLADWVAGFNTERPHSSLGYATPAAFTAGLKNRGAALLFTAGGYAK
jgi:putative transposase